jgi:Helicase associated domain
LWVKEQRRHFTLMKAGKRSHMTDEREQALESIGFCWDTHEGIWGERLRELREYKEEYGDCIVPTSYRKHPKLCSWVHHQRRQFKKFKDGETCHITLERIRALDKLGFAWHCRYPRKNQKPRKTQNQKGRSNSWVESSGESDSDSDIECNNTSESDESDTDSDFGLRPSKRQKAHSVLI